MEAVEALLRRFCDLLVTPSGRDQGREEEQAPFGAGVSSAGSGQSMGGLAKSSGITMIVPGMPPKGKRQKGKGKEREPG